MKEFKGTKGPWSYFYDNDTGPNDAYYREFYTVESEDGDAVGEIRNEEDARLIAAVPELLEALQWALPLAKRYLEQNAFERVISGNRHIKGVYKNGDIRFGMYQEEIDRIEIASEKLNKALGK